MTEQTVDDRNAAVTARVLSEWAQRPAVAVAYYDLPGDAREYFGRRAPVAFQGKVTAWTGETMGTIIHAHVYRGGFGARVVSVRVVGTNGAEYYGRASWDGGNVITLRRCGGAS